MEKEKSCEEGLDPTLLRLGSNSTVACINREKVTFVEGCLACGSKKRICQVTEDLRKKINLVDPNPTSTISNVTVKPTTVSPQKFFDYNFSFHWPPPPSCDLNPPEAIKTTENNPPQQKALDLDRKSSVTDSSPDILNSIQELINPATTHVLDPVAVPISSTISPKSNETITTVTKHPLSPSPSGINISAIGSSSAKTESSREDIHPEASKKSNCVRVLWTKEGGADHVEAACNTDCKKTTVVVVSKGEDQESPTTLQFKCNCKTKTVMVDCKGGDPESPTSVQFKCYCGGFCQFIIFN